VGPIAGFAGCGPIGVRTCVTSVVPTACPIFYDSFSNSYEQNIYTVAVRTMKSKTDTCLVVICTVKDV